MYKIQVYQNFKRLL